MSLSLEQVISDTAPAHAWSFRDVAENLRWLYGIRADIETKLADLSRIPDQDALLESSLRHHLSAAVSQLLQFFERYHFDSAVTGARRILDTLPASTPADVRRRFDDLWDAFLRDGESAGAELIPVAKWRRYEAEAGPEVTHKFPKATTELREANTCYALGRNTAAVFHAMRAAEHGIRALAAATDLAALSSTTPLDYAGWDELIRAIQGKTKDEHLAGWSKPAKARFRAFLSGTLADVAAFKDECRNSVMHTRSGFYSSPMALGWIERVELFMRRLASKLSEDDSTASLLSQTEWQ